MELDDLKDTWKQTPTNKPENSNIMELIRRKNDGPIAALKTAFKRRIKVMVIVPILLLLTNQDNLENILTNIIFWSYIVFCGGIILFAWRNYRIVQKMERMDGMVKKNLEQKIALLETSFKWHITGKRLALLFFMVLFEIVPYFQDGSMLAKWHSLSPLIRISAYATFLIAQHFLSRMVLQRKFGRHLDHLKALVQEMQ